ncbi:MAG: sialidase [Gemmatimonadaceae bacterium]
MTRLRPFAPVLTLLVGAPCALPAQRPATSPVVTAPASREWDALSRLSWRSLGPTNQAGRVSAVVGVPGDPATYFVAGANGGIIKTTNAGTTFHPVFDRESAGSIGAIAIAPSDPNIIYVGTGEGNPRNNASVGDGMYKSVDAGETWTRIGLVKSDKIARIVIDARNPDIVYACSLGREWGPGEERGVFKTVDGGKSWKRSLYLDPQTSCSDISADPGNSNIVYAGMYTYRRWAWHLESGGGNTSVWKTSDGGEHWTRLSGPDASRGLPRKEMDRIGVAVAASDPNIVYVVSETIDEGEMWRSDDAGESWRMTTRDANINFRPFYYADIRVDPANPNRVFALSGGLYLSEDGGLNFRQVQGDVHGDHQAMWIDPLNPKRILEGSDGGWQLSYDAGRTWEVVNTFPFTQFYHINYDMQKPYNVCGGLQDNGSWCGTTIGLSSRGVQRSDWYNISSGDGFFAVPDVASPWIVYSDAQGGMIYRTDLRTGNIKMVYPYPNRVGSVGDRMLGHKYRFNWNSPIAVTPLQPGTVYFGGNVLFRSRDQAQSWEVISPDLTTNDTTKQQHSGGPIVVDNTAAEFHSTLLSVAPSPLDSNVIWTGSDDGEVYVTRDGGKSWTSTFRKIDGLAPNAWIPTVEASHADAGTAYVVADHHQDDDYAPYVYMTTDFGRSWKAIMGDLPKTAGWTHVIREDPRNRNLLYLGTEFGLWASWDRGAHWVSLRGDLPVSPVRDLHVHPRENDLIVATHGRGLYVMDDVTPLQQITQAFSTDVTFFDVRPATRWNYWNKDGNLGFKVWAGENPPYGALLSYYLKSPAKSVSLTVSDKTGTVVRELKDLPSEAGVNRAAWDLKYEPPVGGSGQRRRAAPETPRGRSRVSDRDVTLESVFTPPGLTAVPGVYTLALDVDGRTFTKQVTVELDPRYDIAERDVLAQQGAGLELRDLTTRVNGIVENTNNLLQQLTGLQTQLKGAGDAPSPSAARALVLVDSTIVDLTHFRDSVLTRPSPVFGYRQYPRLREEISTVAGMVWRGINAPTAGEALRLTELHTETNEAQARLDNIVNTRVAKVNELLGSMPHILVPSKPKFVP